MEVRAMNILNTEHYSELKKRIIDYQLLDLPIKLDDVIELVVVYSNDVEIVDVVNVRRPQQPVNVDDDL